MFQQKNSVEKSHVESWGRIVSLHGDLKEKFFDTQSNLELWLNYPLITDVTFEPTRNMINAHSHAEYLPSAMPDNLEQNQDIMECVYPKAVKDFEDKMNIALVEVKRIGRNTIPEEEKKTLIRIQKLLSKVSKENGSTEYERFLAYEKINELLSGLTHVQVTENITREIESMSMKSISAESFLNLKNNDKISGIKESD